jgi:hypothetical protein
LPEGSRPQLPQEEFDYEFDNLYEPYHMAILESGSAHVQVLDRAYRRFMAKEIEMIIRAAGQDQGREQSPRNVA